MDRRPGADQIRPCAGENPAVWQGHGHGNIIAGRGAEMDGCLIPDVFFDQIVFCVLQDFVHADKIFNGFSKPQGAFDIAFQILADDAVLGGNGFHIEFFKGIQGQHGIEPQGQSQNDQGIDNEPGFQG